MEKKDETHWTVSMAKVAVICLGASLFILGTIGGAYMMKNNFRACQHELNDVRLNYKCIKRLPSAHTNNITTKHNLIEFNATPYPEHRNQT